ncbi:transcription elongation factor GreA [Lentilactobacillus kosonis]|uniref:Transcription elongation factor GreA n=1 Tax=Lentilactobacillus kosonis TaxID=2810561 RepID=A0A401FIH8_9LACO|nr:transcription elongation factor GreA [Lentilactobacillus kosonis]GAY72165.1 transcription elongation factor GreA [Lentilactobacillus kosonis]
MSDQFNDITKEGYQIIEQELADLQASRPEKIRILAEARALGDLSENAEYSSAKRDLRHLESRIRFLTKQLQYARIYEPSDNDIVEIGKTVTFEFTDTHEIDKYQIVGTPEVDITRGKISIASPIGKALLGHKTGDTVTVSAPNDEFKITINKITL